MAELLNTAVSWGLKSLLAAVVGLQIIRNLVAPVMDSVKKRASVKSGRGTSGSGKCSEHGHRTGCDKCGSGQKLSGSCDSCSVCSDRCRTDAALWDIVASLSSACSGGTAGF